MKRRSSDFESSKLKDRQRVGPPFCCLEGGGRRVSYSLLPAKPMVLGVYTAHVSEVDPLIFLHVYGWKPHLLKGQRGRLSFVSFLCR